MIKKSCLGIFLVLFAGMTSGTIISQENVSIDLQDESVTLDAYVERLTTENFNWRTSHPVSNIKSEINGNRKNCRVEQLAVGSEIECPTKLRKNFSVSLNYKTSGMTSKKEDAKIFRYSQSIYRPINNYTFKVILPEGTGVLDQEMATTDVINPNTGKVLNEDGRRFVVKWKTKPNLRQPEKFSVIYQELNNQTSSKIIPAGLAMAIVLALSFLIYSRKTNVNSERTFDKLNKDEKEVVNLIRGRDGEMLQKDIVNETDYSKAKISGVVSKLEEKNVVSKEKEGRSNKVTLNKFAD